jgi:hypothetical protein
MKNINFKKWIIKEGKDIFGFDKEINPIDQNISDDPIWGTNIERLSEELSDITIGNKEGSLISSSQVVWGEGQGSLKVIINPDLVVEIKILNRDLQGQNVWITKKVLVLNREGSGGYEEEIKNVILDELVEINKLPLYKIDVNNVNMKRLAEKLSFNIQKVCRPYHYFEGIKELDENNYIIRLGVAGQGVLARDQYRIIENQTLVNFDENTGLIRLLNYNIGTEVTGHAWRTRPSDKDMYFLPNQPEEEISSAIRMAMKWY